MNELSFDVTAIYDWHLYGCFLSATFYIFIKKKKSDPQTPCIKINDALASWKLFYKLHGSSIIFIAVSQNIDDELWLYHYVLESVEVTLTY